MDEFNFMSIFRYYKKIGSYHLPTHCRGAHGNYFFIDPFVFKIEIFAKRPLWDAKQ